MRARGNSSSRVSQLEQQYHCDLYHSELAVAVRIPSMTPMAFSVSRAVCLLLLSLALCHAVSAETDAEKIVGSFTQITILSDKLLTDANNINLVNVLFRGPTISNGFTQIINEVTSATTMISGMKNPLTDPDAKLVVAALTTFVRVHQMLLNAVIGKHGLLSLFFFTEPIRVALVGLEGAVDTFAFYLIKQIPTAEAEATTQFGSLGVTVKAAIEVYGGV